MSRLYFVLMAVLYSALAHSGGIETAVIQIKSRPAAALVDTVRPLVGPQGGVSAFHDKLIVNAGPQQLRTIKKLIAQIDQPARRLIIEVRQRGHLDTASRGVDYGLQTDRLRLGQTPPGSKGQISVHSAETRGRDSSLQRIQALDGRPALIRTGHSTPIYQAHQGVVGNRVVQGFQVRYRDTHSGFHALPRVHGNEVTLEIYQQHERPAANGQFMSQQASTVLRGALGDWLVLGSTGGDSGNQGDHLGRHVRTRRSEDRTLELRVLAVD